MITPLQVQDDYRLLHSCDFQTLFQGYYYSIEEEIEFERKLKRMYEGQVEEYGTKEEE